jgi:nucleoid-associated protein YgaU
MGKDDVVKPEFITDLLKVEQVVGENAAQTSVVREITLPGKIRKITDVDATIRNVTARVIENKVIVEGIIHKQIFFVDDNTGQLREQTVPDEKFVHFVDVPGAVPGMNVQVHTRIEFVGHEFIREIRGNTNNNEADSLFRQTVVLEIFAKVTESIQLEVVVDVRGIDPKRIEKELLKVESVIGEGASQVTVLADVEFPREARKIKNIDTEVRDIRTRVIENKVIVEGVLHKQIFFVAMEDDVVYEVSVNESFTHFIDIPGAFPGANVQAYPRVEFVNVVIDPYDRRFGRQTAVIDIFVKVTETIQVEVVTDIKGVKATKELLKVSQVVGEGAKQHKITADLTAPFPARKIAGPPDVRFQDVTARVIENKVLIEGVLVKQIFFVRQNFDDVHEFEVRETFTLFIDIPGARPGHVVQVYPRVEFVDLEIDNYDRRRIRQVVVIEVFIKVTEFVQLEVVVKLLLDDVVVEPKPGLTVYVVQKSDTLFKIAQRFGTTVAAILRVNPEIKDPNLIFPGQKILIPAAPKG